MNYAEFLAKKVGKLCTSCEVPSQLNLIEDNKKSA